MKFLSFFHQAQNTRFGIPTLAIFTFVAAYLLTFSSTQNENLIGNTEFNKTLHKKELLMNSELDTLLKRSYKKSFDDIFKASPSEYKTLYRDKGLALLIYEGDTLKFWSDNAVSVENYMEKVCLDERIVKLKNGWYETIRKTDLAGRIYIGIILIKHEYSYQNKYLTNTFEKDFAVLPGTEIEIKNVNATNSILSTDGHYLFSLVNKSAGRTETSEWKIWLTFFLNLSGFLLVLLFLFKEAKSLKSKVGSAGAQFILVSSIIVLRFISIKLNFPGAFYDLSIFGPTYYGNANSFWISNLGDFLINAGLLFILSLSIANYFKKTVFLWGDKKFKRWGLGFLFLIIPAFSSFILNEMFRGLVQNSNISFNINNIFELTTYSYACFFLIGILLATFFVIAACFANLLLRLTKSRSEISILFIITLLIHTTIFHLLGYIDLVAVMWPFSIFLLLLLWRREPDGQIYSFSLIISLVLIFSFYATHLVTKENQQREHSNRIVLAENFSAEQDAIGENLFTELENKIETDTLLIKYARLATRDLSAFEKRVQQQYFSGYWDKYDIKISFFDSICNPILRSNSVYSENIGRYEELLGKNGVATESKKLFYLKNSSGKISYLTKLDLRDTTVQKPSAQGTLFVELDAKFVTEEIGFPDLLLARNLEINRQLLSYSYAKYKNRILVNRSGKFQYRLTPEQFENTETEKKFYSIDDWSHLAYHQNGETLVVISLPIEGWLSKTTSFSYIFAFFSLLLLVSLWLRQLIFSKDTISNLSFKYRIQLVLVLIVLVSLGLFGGGSIYYIRQQYLAKNAEIIGEKGRSVVLELQSLIEENKLNNAYKEYATYKLKKYSNVFFTDVNLYDLNGNLYASSRPKVFDEGLVSKKMNADAFLQIALNKKQEFIHDENIGSLAYLSAYLPVKNKSGRIQAYLNLPYFAKQSDLEKEISSFMVALINVYVLLFALSVLAAIFISNYLTHPLRLIQVKMRQVKLGRASEEIEWSNKDEIGSLVTEYNRMIKELATSAELLAQSERESAWREMAKQVAHEIKNPLTPMRLSIQLLQRAYTDKAPDIDQRVERLSKTMIEQIDTLASIANAFSDFAKMPKVNNEAFDLRVLVQNTISLFHGTSEEVEFSFYDNGITNAWIYADKEQLIRVFNNLFRNGIQAIPENKKGVISISLSKQNQTFVFAIKDNGVGIPDDMYDKIFVPNFTTKTHGMGLGLAIVKNSVESCNGKVWFETIKEIGTTFYVSFPEYLD
jgi:two-component system, NtrC family, nitrogen regulation sensor histidine kinase NtrY